MSKRCPNCGTEVPEGATFCPNCGQSMTPGSPEPTIQQPAAQQAAPAAAAPGPAAAPPQGGAPAPAKKSRKGLIAGGCAVAGLLGLVGLLILGAIIFFFVAASKPQSSSTDPGSNGGQTQPVQGGQTQPVQGGQTQPGQGSAPVTPAKGGQDQPPAQGSLEQLVQPQVGNFKLKKIVKNTEVISKGATDAYNMLYETPEGVQLTHALWALPSADASNQVLKAFVDKQGQSGYTVKNTIPVKNSQGQEVGTAVLLQGEKEVVVWSNSMLFCMAVGPPGAAVDFFKNSKKY